MMAQGVSIGIGVDGSASNDSGNLLAEARQAMLLQRVAGGAGALDPRDALYLATRGGAKVLGRGDCGALVPGMRADFAVWQMGEMASAGAWDVVAALVLCPPAAARDVFVEGRAVVRDGVLVQSRGDEILNAASLSRARLMACAA